VKPKAEGKCFKWRCAPFLWVNCLLQRIVRFSSTFSGHIQIGFLACAYLRFVCCEISQLWGRSQGEGGKGDKRPSSEWWSGKRELVWQWCAKRDRREGGDEGSMECRGVCGHIVLDWGEQSLAEVGRRLCLVGEEVRPGRFQYTEFFFLNPNPPRYLLGIMICIECRRIGDGRSWQKNSDEGRGRLKNLLMG